MEEILHKTFINEGHIQKLSPDFIPNFPLRMDMRRSFFKDNHSVASGGVVKSGCWQRKSLKRTRDCYKYNKEIAKIRNSFSNMDLKNKVMLKYVDTIKPKTISNKDKTLIVGNKKEIEDEKEHFLDEITNDLNNMAIECDSEFKLNKKPKVENTCPRQNRAIRAKNKITQNLEPQTQDIHEYTGDILRIECTYFNKTQNVAVSVNGDVNEHDDNNTDTIEQNNVDHNYTLGGDLQSLLIMMGLSPKANNNKENDTNSVSSFNYNNTHIAEIEQFDKNDLCPDDEFNENFTTMLCITPMRVKISTHEEALLRKCIEKWRSFVKNKKEQSAPWEQFSQQRQVALDSFFDKLAKKKEEVENDNSPESVKKAKLLARDYNTYQRRYKLQKHIIALQRAKLEEQNRMIEELKYNKIIEQSRSSVDAVREEVRKAYFEIDRQLKPKIKCLSNELKLQDLEEPSLVLHCLKVPQFLKRMEKRAREREEKHAMIRERRKQMEEERIRLKQQAEIAKAEMDKEEKMQRLKEMKEKRKREKIETIRKKQYAARLRALIVMADLHYERNLKTKYGIVPFKKLLAIRRDNLEKANAHYKFQLKNNVFLNWMWYTEDMWFERNFKAEDFYRKKLIRKTIEALRRNKYQYVLKKQVADDYYDLYVTQLGFRKFREGIEIIKRENEIKLKRAIAYYNGSLVYKAFTCWQTLPALNALKREQDARKARWREKVLQVVPDYVPPED